MKAGGGKQKGASFEREICKDLSLWVSDGSRGDIFARSAMSGGRATLLHRKRQEGSAVCGDIAAVHPLGSSLLSIVFVECKHIKNADFLQFFLCGRGTLARFWVVAITESEKFCKWPLVLVKQNRLKTLMLSPLGLFPSELPPIVEAGPGANLPHWKLHYFDDLLAQPYNHIAPWLLDKRLSDVRF